MSLTRRLAAGLPAVGVTALAALAFAGSPATAAQGDTGRAGAPAAMVTPCPDDAARTKCVDGAAAGYGYGNNAAPSTDTTSPGPDDDRGQPGYGGESPSPSPSASTATPSPSVSTPTGGANSVPPGGGASPAAVPSTPPGGGVSAGGTLPLTGAPLSATLSVGAVLIAGGAAAVWYTRRRRDA